MIKQARYALFAVTTAILLSLNPSWAGDTIVLSTGINPPLVDGETSRGFVESVAREVFSRIGYDLEVSIVPSKLALIQSNRGVSDGLILRVNGLEAKYPNLRRVPEPIMDTEFVAFSKKSISAIDSWQALSQFEVSYVNGWRIFEQNVTASTRVLKADSPERLFEMLDENKIEVVLYEKWQGLQLLKDMGLDDVDYFQLPLQKVPQFMYLHEKHESLVTLAAEQLKLLKEEGTYQSLHQSLLGSIDIVR